MKVIKEYENDAVSVVVRRIDSIEEIIDQRPLEEHEDFSTFHPETKTVYTYKQNEVEKGKFGTHVKNVDGFTLNIKRSY